MLGCRTAAAAPTELAALALALLVADGRGATAATEALAPGAIEQLPAAAAAAAEAATLVCAS